MSPVSNIVIFIGPPGSGKGSLSQLCVKSFGWMQLSTGYLCRKHIAEQTAIGKQIDFSIKAGKLIDDRLIIDMVECWLIGNAVNYEGIILDGFPRTVAQAKALDDIMFQRVKNSRLNVVRLVASFDTVVSRLATRYICQNKDCQMVYSAQVETKFVSPKQTNVCDGCQSTLVRRADDAVEAVQERIKTYQGYERFLVDFYRQKGQFVFEIDVEKPLDAVFDEFKRVMNIQPL
jgi:adenylate kinase